MRVLVTHPGRHGDLLWALPAIRALYEATGAQIDLGTSPKYAGLVTLIEQQPYVHHAFAISGWEIQETAPMTPREPPGLPDGYDQVYHLGYEGWPAVPLPFDVAKRVGVPIDLGRPWITVPTTRRQIPVAVGFTDEHFELKYGLWTLLIALEGHSLADWSSLSGHRGSRWVEEGYHGPVSWLLAAELLAVSQVFFGCCSALHVLACALGKPCVLMEPNPQRHHPIFWPYGMDGPQVTIVRGGDGQPTFDARHCADALRKALEQAGG